MGDSEPTFEPDWDAFWKMMDESEAMKKRREATREALRKARGYPMEEEDPKPTFYSEMQDSLPEKLQFQESEKLYPKYLPMDDKKLFPLDNVYGGKHAYRGGDRRVFKKSDGKRLNVSSNTSALILVNDPTENDRLLAFGYPYLVPQEDSYETFAEQSCKKESNAEELAAQGQEKHSASAECSKGSASTEQKTSPGDTASMDMASSSVSGDGDQLVGNGHLDPRWLKVRFRPDSQRPCVSLSFSLDASCKERTVIVDIYGAHLHSTTESPGIEMWTGKQHPVLQHLPKGKDLEKLDGNLAKLASLHSLWRTNIRLKAPNAYKTTGITDEEIQAIRNKDPSQLTDGERFLITLARAEGLSIFMQTSEIEQAALPPFIEYFRTAMYAAAHLGNFWWYALVTDGERDALQQFDYPFGRVPVPRWMVTKWQVEYSGDGSNAEPQSAHMQQCARFNPVVPITDRNKDPDLFTFGTQSTLPTKDLNTHPEFENLYVTTVLAKSSSGLLWSRANGQDKEPEKPSQPAGRGKPPGTGKRSQGRGRGSSGALGSLDRGHGGRGSGGRGDWVGNRRVGGFFSASG